MRIGEVIQLNEKIAQLVDSAGNLPREIIKKYSIKEIPFYYTFDGKKYFAENRELTHEEFYQHMKDYPDMVPKTAAPNPEDWISGFEDFYKKEFKKFVVTTISSELSASFQNACLAKDIYVERKRDVDIRVISSRSCTCGQAALEIGVARSIKNGCNNLNNLSKKITSMISSMSTLFTVETLKYMKAGGRIGGASAFLGKLINIKPISEFVNGVVKPIKVVRGRKKSLEKMTNIALSRIKNPDKTIICTQQALCKEDETYIVKLLKDTLGKGIKISTGLLGTVIGAHSGPGSIGIGFVEI